LGAEFLLLNSGRRQVALAAIGAALTAWGWAIPSEESQQRTASLEQRRRELALELSDRIERIGTDLNRMPAGQNVPGLIDGNDIPRLTAVSVRADWCSTEMLNRCGTGLSPDPRAGLGGARLAG
jgi:hypothetical protein